MSDFWDDFWDTWGALIIVIWVSLGSFILGMGFADTLNPYEQCKRMYETPEDISECVWIKENP